MNTLIANINALMHQEPKRGKTPDCVGTIQSICYAIAALFALGPWSQFLASGAEVPGILGFQAKLAGPAMDLTGTREFKFALVSKAGDETYWSHNQTSTAGNEPGGPGLWLTVEQGAFAVALGDVTVSNMLAEIPAGVFTNSEIFVRVWVGDEQQEFHQLTPDTRLTSAAYALAAGTSLGPVTENQLPTNVARLNAKQTFTGINTFSAPTRLTNSYNILVGRHIGDGSWLTNIRASSIVGPSLFGTGDNQRRTPAFLEPDQVFTGSNTFTGVTQLRNPANQLVGAHVGDGAGLSNINAKNIVWPQNGLPSSLPRGFVMASLLPQDPKLLTNGFRRIASMRPQAWQNGNSSNAASARFAHTAVWDGQRMIIWGGRIGLGTTTINSGAMYYPEADQWEAIPTINAPSPRSDHTAVWNGSEMLVWGGNGPTGSLNTGGRFDPVKRTWRSISVQSQNGAPAARQGHVAVWTGSRMVIWGGRNETGLLSDGALYNPGSDTWSPINLPNPPTARTGASAFWIGGRLLVWGGEDSSGAIRSGSQLLLSGNNPDRWIPISLANAPIERRAHAAVWTGQKVLVWGGEAGGYPIQGGAAYDPIKNDWEPLPDTNAPAPRFGHVGVWTGDLMLILGGTTGRTELSAGWALDHLGGSWWPLSITGSPQPRAEATACWTGSEVLVFGGRSNGKPISSLQRLAPELVWHLYVKS